MIQQALAHASAGIEQLNHISRAALRNVVSAHRSFMETRDDAINDTKPCILVALDGTRTRFILKIFARLHWMHHLFCQDSPKFYSCPASQDSLRCAEYTYSPRMILTTCYCPRQPATTTHDTLGPGQEWYRNAPCWRRAQLTLLVELSDCQARRLADWK